MTTASDLASLAALLADETRATICLALLDGRAWTAGELATHARVAPSTATEHLHRLVDGGLLVERRQGRHRYVQLADPSVAYLLEDLSARIEPRPGLGPRVTGGDRPGGSPAGPHLLRPPRRTARDRGDRRDDRSGPAGSDRRLRPHPGRPDLADRHARTDPAELRSGKRPLARGCLDWTERRQHLAGLAGARVREKLFGNGWVARVGSGRAVRVTPNGRAALRDLLGLSDFD